MYDLSALLGDLAVALGKPDGAVRYYGVLLTAPNAETKAIGVYRLAQLELGQGKTAEARTRFQQIASLNASTASTTRLKSLAEVGLAVCDARDGKPQQALDQLKQMVAKYDSTDQELFARIYNAQGACYVALKNTNLAVLSYLRTDLLFFTDAEAMPKRFISSANFGRKLANLREPPRREAAWSASMQAACGPISSLTVQRDECLPTNTWSMPLDLTYPSCISHVALANHIKSFGKLFEMQRCGGQQRVDGLDLNTLRLRPRPPEKALMLCHGNHPSGRQIAYEVSDTFHPFSPLRGSERDILSGT